MPIIGGRQASVRGLGFQGAGAPAQVTGLTATNVGSGRAFNNGRIDLAWTAPATNGAPITGYFIERSTNGSTYSTLVSNTGNTNVSYSDTGLTSAQQYWYRVSAINAVGTGLASTAANATATTVPQAPTIGTATAGNASASVTFTANATGGSAITGFTVTSSPGSITGTGSASPITVSGLSNGTAYTFTVTATNANGTSAASAASNSVTPVAPSYTLVGTFNASGSYTIPAGRNLLAFSLRGAGIAGGAGGNASSTSGAGGPGGRGGFGVAVKDISVSAGSVFNYTIGGSGGSSNVVQAANNTTIASATANAANFNVGTGVTAAGGNIGNGGPGVVVNQNGVGGNAGGAGGTLSFNLTGLGTQSWTVGGGGGGGGSGANRNNFGSSSGAPGGAGGSGGNAAAGAGGSGGNASIAQECGVPVGGASPGSSGVSAPAGSSGGGGGGGGGASSSINFASGGSPGNGGSGQITIYVL